MAAQHDDIASEWVPTDTFGARLALIRQHLGGWNVSKTAKLCGLDEQSWRNWEAGGGVRDYEGVCFSIARATGCSRVWLAAGGALQNRKKNTAPDLRIIPGEATTPSPPRGRLVRVPARR